MLHPRTEVLTSCLYWWRRAVHIRMDESAYRHARRWEVGGPVLGRHPVRVWEYVLLSGRIQSAPHRPRPHADRFMNLFSGRAVLLRQRLPDRRLPWVRRVRARSEDRHPLRLGRRDAAVHHRHVP